jgi:chloramphenicol O-acetyltransferase
MLKLFSLFSETFSYLKSRFQEGFTEFAKNSKKKIYNEAIRYQRSSFSKKKGKEIKMILDMRKVL